MSTTALKPLADMPTAGTGNSRRPAHQHVELPVRAAFASDPRGRAS